MSASSHLSFFRGDDVTVYFTMSPPQDITGWTLAFTCRDTLNGTSQFTRTPTITDGPRGKFKVTIAKANTDGLTAGRYVWDVRRTDSGSYATVADGFIDLKQEVTA